MGGSKTLPNTNIYWSIYLGYINMYGINQISTPSVHTGFDMIYTFVSPTSVLGGIERW